MSPSFGLHIDGIPHLIRLHLSKNPKMDSHRAALMAHLMRLAYPELPLEHEMAILDVKKGILYEEITLSDTVVQKFHREVSSWVE